MPISVLLYAHDLAQTRAFYHSVLGFTVSGGAEGVLVAEHQGGKLLFTPHDLWKKAAAGCSGTVYFTVPDVDAYYATVKDAASVAWPLQDMPYGSREFGVVDCNGYHLAFQQQV